MAENKAEELIRQLDGTRQEMLNALETLDRETEVFPGWRVKHFLAHLTGWEDAANVSLRAHMQGEGYEIPAFRGINDYNAQSVLIREGLAYDQIFREWELVREELRRLLSELPPGKLDEPTMLPWGRQGTLTQLIEVVIEHEQEHCRDVLRLKN